MLDVLTYVKIASGFYNFDSANDISYRMSEGRNNRILPIIPTVYLSSRRTNSPHERLDSSTYCRGFSSFCGNSSRTTPWTLVPGDLRAVVQVAVVS